jgi:hypothetical protein
MMEHIPDRQRLDDEIIGQRKALARSLSPMLKMMRIWGLYFGFYGRSWGFSQSQETQLQETEKKDDGRTPRKHAVIYPTVVLFTLWTNVLRILLVFQVGDKFDFSTIWKITQCLAYLQCAVMQTSYFIASQSGKLDQFLDGLNVTENFNKVVHKYAVACIIYNSFATVHMAGNTFFGFFLPKTDSNLILAPFVSLIPVDNTSLYVLKVLMLVVYLFVMQSWVWPIMMNLMLTAIMVLLFRQFNCRFREALSPRGQFSGSLKMFRSRHQALSEKVRMVDSFMNVGNVASIVCQMITVIVVLFLITIIGVSDPFTGLNFYILLLTNAVGLAICTFSGILVNHAVSFFQLVAIYVTNINV